LRGIAVLGVLFVHSGNSGGIDMSSSKLTLQKLVGSGRYGVQLFYIASSFTLFLSFKNRFAKENFPIKNFFIRRFFRIAPMWWLAMAYYLFQNGFNPKPWLGDAGRITIFNILSNATFLHSFNPYFTSMVPVVPGGWSVGVEMIFYLFVPLLFLKIKNITQAVNLFIIVSILRYILLLFLRNITPIAHREVWESYLYFFLPNQLPVFTLGIVLYFIIVEKQTISDISYKSVLLISSFILLSLSTGINVMFPNITLFGIGFMLLAIGLSKGKNKFLINPLLIHIGKISYSMYLVHFAVLHVMQKVMRKLFIIYPIENVYANFTIMYLSVIIITVIISTVTYNRIEIPFQNLGKRLIKKVESRK
jgi:peptidoglycan/LPS O-acetylase OafA/YrhL